MVHAWVPLAGQSSTDDVVLACSGHRELDLESLPFETFAGRIWALRHALTSYDAWYVAVAEALSMRLATLDVRLSKTSGVVCEFLTPAEDG